MRVGFVHKIRRSIAIVFILTFLIIECKLLVEMMGIPSWITALVVVLNVVGLLIISAWFRTAKHSDIEEIDRAQLSAPILEDYKLNEHSQIFKLARKLFPIVIINVLFVVFHIGYCIVNDTGQNPEARDPVLIWKLIFFSLHTFLLSWSFLVYALYRKVELKPASLRSGILKSIYGFIRNASYTPTLMKMYFLVSLIMFMILCIIVVSNSPLIEVVNPLNFFLVILNFFVAFLAFLDRVVKTSMKSEKIGLNSRRFGIVLFSLMILFIAINNMPSYYHDLDQRTYTEAEDLNYMDLESYTRNFLDSSTTDVVYFIAADGGGLKAAYWTMNVVHKFCLEKPHFFDNTFLTTGASGGMVGLGMYTYLYGQKLTAHERKTKIEELGATNFLNNDLAGLTIKTPVVKLFPFLAGAISDRTAAMSSRYFQLTSKSDEAYDNIQKKPFAHLWQKNRYIGLPLLVVNATKTEDGSRGIIHPLKHIKGDGMIGPLTDLTDYVYENGRLTGVESLNLPDGLFTSNRFPIFSPYARVEGKGHFVDGGYLENSGLSTVYHFLNYMKLQADPTDSTNVFTQFFEQKKIVVVSIGNDRSGHIRNDLEELMMDSSKLNKTGSIGSIGAILGAVSGGGLTAMPLYYDYLFESLEKNPANADMNLHFERVDMPFPYTINQANGVYNGQIVDCHIGEIAETNKQEILDHIYGNPCSICPGDNPYHLTPPLGRFMSRPSQDYMKDMINHPEVEEAMISTLAH